MAHFAHVDENNIVTEVIVADQDVIDTGEFGDPATWIKTSYNTRRGVYYTPNTNEPDPNQSKAFRKNYAGIGMVWDPVRDAFYDAQPYPSWTLDSFGCYWVPPVPMPPQNPGYQWEWDEAKQEWVEVPTGA